MGYCQREKLNIPRGERYELCRSVHAEANAIISAPRERMIGAILYMTGKNADGTYAQNSCCCAMCKRLVINSGIEKVIMRNDKENFITYDVSDWITNDDSLTDKMGY